MRFIRTTIKYGNNGKRARSKSALVLVAVMWMIVVMTLIVTVLARTSRLDSRISLATAERIRCKWACRAGIETAIGVLNDDSKSYDSLYDTWADDLEDFNDIQLDMCSYTVEVFDESSKININTAPKDKLLYLPDMTEDIVNSILDWRDKDDDEKTGGAEIGYYTNLPNGYQARNAQFRSIRELLLVKDVTPALFYGNHSDPDVSEENSGWINYLTCSSYEKNRDANGYKRVNINKASEVQLQKRLNIRKSYAKWIVENRKKGFKSLADLITKDSTKEPRKTTERSENAAPLDIKTIFAIADNITLFDNYAIPGKININTAGLDVLVALLEGEEQAAVDIIQYRNSIMGFATVADVVYVDSITKKNARNIIDFITTRSDVYTVRCFASADTTSVTRHVEAMVDRRRKPVEITYWNTGAKY